MNNSQNSKTTLKHKKLIIAIICIFLVIAIAISAFFIIRNLGKKGLTSSNVDIQNNNSQVTIEDDVVIYGDQKYKYNENVVSILVMGLDFDYNGGNNDYGENGQADALFLMTVDTITGKTTVTAIPRDTMVDIEMYSASGIYAGMQNKQICLAFAYGDGKEKSCRITANALSRFLYGMPISAYYAIDLNSIATINNYVGGVEVTPPYDFLGQVPNKGTEIQFKKGQSVKLYGDNAKAYLWYRDESDVNSSYVRMERHIDYLKKLTAKAVEKTKSDFTFPIKAYYMLSSNAITDIDINEVTYLTSVLFNRREDISIEFKQLVGSKTVGEDGFVQFHPDEDALFNTVLELFYTKVE